MAKKMIEKQEYPHSPLVISKERFCELLSEQIAKGKELLKIVIPVMPVSKSSYSYWSVQSSHNEIVYEENAEKDFIASYNRWNNRNKSIYSTSFEAPESVYYHEYELQIFHKWGFDIIKEYKEEIGRLINHMAGDIERSDLFNSKLSSSIPRKAVEAETRPISFSKEIFIVHGHNNEMKQSVARVVSKLGLTPIILHEKANGGNTIIEKFEENAKMSSFAIILLSADDLAASEKVLTGIDDKDIRPKLEKRARQNVVFEMGYFAGKLGRSRVFYLLQNGVAKPGDLDGIVYTPYDENGGWTLNLVKELQNAGYLVSADKLL